MIRILIFFILLIPTFSFAGTYWVSSTGSASWVDCQSVIDPGENYCSLSIANINAVAGDIVKIKSDGIYTTPIAPSNSGTSANKITYQTAQEELPIFTIIDINLRYALRIIDKSYIVIDGIKSDGSLGFFYIGYGATYNEVKNSIFQNSDWSNIYSYGLITSFNTATSMKKATNNNWVHNNIFTTYGKVVGCTDHGTIRIAAYPTELLGEDEAYNNTFEDNVFSYGGHDSFDLGGRYNVIRNNVFHNEEVIFPYDGCTSGGYNIPESGYHGNRNIIVSAYSNTDRNLIESNRIGYAGTPPDDDGAMGIENAGNRIIIRYNYIFGNGGSGVYLKNQSIMRPEFNKIYNNTIYKNGFGDPSIGSGFKYGFTFGGMWDYINVSHNGVIYRCIMAHWTSIDKEPGVSIGWETYWAVGALEGARVLNWATYLGQRYDTYMRPVGNSVINNIVYDNFNEYPSSFLTQNLNVYLNNFNSDPNFDSTDMSDMTHLEEPTLKLLSGSLAIGTGSHLTNVHADDIGMGITLKVVDAMFFQDGTWGSALTGNRADWIAIGTFDNIVEIVSVDYNTNNIIIASSVDRNSNDPIWLYKKSDGNIVLQGSAPNYGAYQGLGESDVDPTCPENPNYCLNQQDCSTYWPSYHWYNDQCSQFAQPVPSNAKFRQKQGIPSQLFPISVN